jgi:hypothetical protein
MRKAWMVRSVEREALLESLQEKTGIFKRASLDDLFMEKLMFAFCEIFLGNSNTLMIMPFEEKTREFLRVMILPEIAKFARCEEERRFLILEFFGWLVREMRQRYVAELTNFSNSNPQTVFRAVKASADVTRMACCG